MKDGKVFLDRDPQIFYLMLNYLRNNRVKPQIEDNLVRRQLNQEIRYWGLNTTDTYQYLQELLNSEPQGITEVTLNKWKEIGPLNLD